MVKFSVKSYLRPYDVSISEGSVVGGGEPLLGVEPLLQGLGPADCVLVIDKNVHSLYGDMPLVKALAGNTMIIEATEEEKSIEGVIRLYRRFLGGGITRRHRVIAAGGGIIQDIAGFACHTYMRGLKWWFIPTTLLAQADSCIGSKTSINFETKKNILGSFYPPERIFVDPQFLKTLKRDDITSGIGEIIKVHCMDREDTLRKLGEDMDSLKGLSPEAVNLYIGQSLGIKRRFIEDDEFDTGHRLLLNYGHCFGHALEAASDFAVPHGIGVIFGIEFANLLSLKRGVLSEREYGMMSGIVKKSLAGYKTQWVEPEKILYFLKHDKKRTGAGLTVIICEGIGRQKKVSDVSVEEFAAVCSDFKASMKECFNL